MSSTVAGLATGCFKCCHCGSVNWHMASYPGGQVEGQRMFDKCARQYIIVSGGGKTMMVGEAAAAGSSAPAPQIKSG